MTVKFIEPGGDATFNVAATTGGGLWSSVQGTPTVVTDFVHGNSRFSVYTYFAALPQTNDVDTILTIGGSGGDVIHLRISSAGVLQLWDGSDGARYGSLGATLTAGAWNRISLAWTITSSTVNSFRFYVNGILSISLTNVTLLHTSSTSFALGNINSFAVNDFRASDFYVDDSSSLLDTSDIWVTAKRPVANGSLNQFTTQVGAGGSGYGMGHSPQVNERVLSTTNGWSLSNTTVQTEEYSIEGRAVGDINLTAARIIDYMGWISAKVDSTSNSPVHHILVAGVATAKTMTTSAAIYTQVAGSAIYPAGNTDIGMDGAFTTTPHTTSLFEAGVIVAYNPLFTLTYTAGTGGTITGTSPQYVDNGANGNTVSAVANAGYAFSSWSDGVLTASRTDLAIAADLTVSASFVLVNFGIFINGIDKTNLIEWDTFTKTEILTKEPDTLEFLIRNYPSKTYRPSLGDEVIVFNNGTRIFGGVVISSVDTIDGLLRYFDVTCEDYTQILNRKLATKTYTSQTVHDIIVDLISTYAPTFTTANVVASVTIATVQFNYLSLAACLTKLTQLIGGGYDWNVDYSKDIHFFQTSGIVAPFSLTDSSQNFHYGSLVINQDTSQLRNYVTVRGGLAVGTSVDNKQVADGVQRVFFVGYRLTTFAAFKALAASPTVFVALNAGVDGRDAPASFDVLYNADKGLMTFPDATKPAANDVVRYTGIPSFPIIAASQNGASISTYGQYEFVIVDLTITSQDAALKRANAELLNYSLPSITGNFVTYTDGLATGQTLTINSTIRGINASYKIQQIVTTLKKADTSTLKLIYSVDFLSTIDVTLVDVLNKLLVTDPANSIVLGTNEVLELLFDFPEAFAFTDTLHTPTTSSPPYVYDTAKYNLSTWG